MCKGYAAVEINPFASSGELKVSWTCMKNSSIISPKWGGDELRREAVAYLSLTKKHDGWQIRHKKVPYPASQQSSSSWSVRSSFLSAVPSITLVSNVRWCWYLSRIKPDLCTTTHAWADAVRRAEYKSHLWISFLNFNISIQKSNRVWRDSKVYFISLRKPDAFVTPAFHNWGKYSRCKYICVI